jgi:tetratricopeptide (TPR) repeat protein
MPIAIATSEMMLLKTGYYYWHSGESLRAITLADKIVSKNSRSIEGILLRADANISLKRYTEALKDYQHALKIFNSDGSRNSEPPEFILTAIAWLKEQF